jgi:hypothetical protein
MVKNIQGGEGVDDFDGFEADGDDLLDEAEDVGLVVGVVGVVGDAAAAVGFDAVLVDYPFEGGAVAEFVVVDLGRDAVDGEEVVVRQAGLSRERRIFSTR